MAQQMDVDGSDLPLQGASSPLPSQPARSGGDLAGGEAQAPAASGGAPPPAANNNIDDGAPASPATSAGAADPHKEAGSAEQQPVLPQRQLPLEQQLPLLWPPRGPAGADPQLHTYPHVANMVPSQRRREILCKQLPALMLQTLVAIAPEDESAFQPSFAKVRPAGVVHSGRQLSRPKHLAAHHSHHRPRAGRVPGTRHQGSGPLTILNAAGTWHHAARPCPPNARACICRHCPF